MVIIPSIFSLNNSNADYIELWNFRMITQIQYYQAENFSKIFNFFETDPLQWHRII